MILYPSENVRRLGEGEGEIVYTRRKPRPTTSSEIFTMSEGESEVHVREQHIVYLITYSRADLEKIPMRQTFAETVCEAFAKTTHATVKQWVVSREMHANTTDSTSANIFHYHMALKLQKGARWFWTSDMVLSLTLAADTTLTIVHICIPSKTMTNAQFLMATLICARQNLSGP